MTVPEAELIEEAARSLSKIPVFVRDQQMVELESFGDEEAINLGASGLSEDFKIGYALGLQTARALLSVTPAAIQAKIDF